MLLRVSLFADGAPCQLYGRKVTRAHLIDLENGAVLEQDNEEHLKRQAAAKRFQHNDVLCKRVHRRREHENSTDHP